jgi:hypothetical protein
VKVEQVTGSGTGVFRRSANVYAVEGAGARMLLSYPLNAYVVGWGLGFAREIRGSTIAFPEVVGPDSRITAEFEATYWIDDESADDASAEEAKLFEYRWTCHASWDHDALTFVDGPSAELPLSRVDELFGDAQSEFVTRHVDRIIDVVRGSETRLRWLTRMLAKTPDSVEKRRLVAELQITL